MKVGLSDRHIVFMYLPILKNESQAICMLSVCLLIPRIDFCTPKPVFKKLLAYIIAP